MNIKLYDKETYPNEIINIINENDTFFKERTAFNKNKDLEYQESDRVADPERNMIFEKRYREIKKDIGNILEKHKISAFHYTRLTKEEYVRILEKEYLSTPSEEKFFYRKIHECEDISKAARERLARDVQLEYDKKIKSNPQDKNKICFTYSEIERDDRGISNFISNWGGEFLYRDCAGYFIKEEVDLTKIGKPYQIEVDVIINIENIDNFARIILGEESVEQGCSAKNIKIYNITAHE